MNKETNTADKFPANTAKQQSSTTDQTSSTTVQPLSQKSKSRNTMRATCIRTKTAPMQLPFLHEAKRLACTPQPASGRSISCYLSGYVSYPVWMRGPLARKSNQTNTHTHTLTQTSCSNVTARMRAKRAGEPLSFNNVTAIYAHLTLSINPTSSK